VITKQLVFYFFAVLALGSALSVIISRNCIRSVLSLVLTFFATACIWMILEAEFLAITLVLVYVGAVLVLFLFVVMMLGDKANTRGSFVTYLPLGVCIPLLLLIILAYGLGTRQFGLEHISSPGATNADFSNVKLLGRILYTEYLYPLELAGVLLLVAIIAAITLVFTSRGKIDAKKQNISQQINIKKADRIKLIDLNGELR
jgi:NADH-quinone oxidoreductase subunit J